MGKGIGIAPSTGDEVCQERRDTNFQSCVVQITKRMDQSNFNDNTVRRAAEACQYSVGDSRAQVDPLFAGCVFELSGYFGVNNFDATGNYCSRVKVPGYAGCVGNLSQAGLRNPEQLVALCNTEGGQQVTDCVGQKGNNALAYCMDKYDPVTIARKQAEERRRIEQERIRKEAAAKEAARQAAQKAADDAKRKAADEAQRKADEQKRRDDEAKKNNGGVGTTPTPANPAPQPGGVGTTPVPKPAPQPSNPTPAPVPPKSTTPPPAPQPAPQDPAQSGGGVIVDLPNF